MFFIFICTFADKIGVMELKTIMKRLGEKWRAFRQWQQKPYEVAPVRSGVLFANGSRNHMR